MRRRFIFGVAVSICIAIVVLIAAIIPFKPDPGVLLLDAAETGDLPKVKSLIAQHALINQASLTKFGWTPLIGAIYHDQTNVVRYLVQSGANVNLADDSGKTPLIWAIASGDKGLPVVDYLINHGADLNAKDKYGLTALDYAKSDPPKPQLIKALEAAQGQQTKP